MRHVVSTIGKVLVTLGVLILLFVGYQLWGTGIYTARAQHQAEQDFDAALDTVAVTPTSAPVGVTAPTATTLAAPAPPSPAESDVVAHLVIPKIGVDAYVFQGTDGSVLRKGPGHYPATPFPGQRGNAGIAGHRTTYGAPFGSLDGLQKDDVIQITTLQGDFTYRVYDVFVVSPGQAEVLDPDPSRPATITLTTCHPKYSAAQRLVVHGELELPPAAQPLPSTVDPDDPAVEAAATRDPLATQSGSKLPTVLAGVILALVGGAWWFFFHRRPRWTTWVIGAVPFAIALSVFYYFLERALPSNY